MCKDAAGEERRSGGIKQGGEGGGGAGSGGLDTFALASISPLVPSKVKFAAAQQCWHWLRRLVTVGIPCQSAKALLAHVARCRCAIYDRKCVVVINPMGGQSGEGGAGKVLTAWARTCGDALCFSHRSCWKSKLGGETRVTSVSWL